jgi:hypothetical protein
MNFAYLKVKGKCWNQFELPLYWPVSVLRTLLYWSRTTTCICGTYKAVNFNFQNEDTIIIFSILACVDKYLLMMIYTKKLEVEVNDLPHQMFKTCCEVFVALPSSGFTWKLKKFCKEVRYDMKIVNPASRVIELWAQWNKSVTSTSSSGSRFIDLCHDGRKFVDSRKSWTSSTGSSSSL